ncbi:MAG: DUF1707 and DUF4870 domain-containing protein [Streptosporangiales bacterium]
MTHLAARPATGFVTQPWLRVSTVERDRVVGVLQEAYAQGRIDHAEFDARVGDALAARTYAELDAPLRGLIAPATPLLPQPAPVAPPSTAGERVCALLMHWSAYLAFFLIPAIVAGAEGRRPTYLRQQAVEAVNFNLTFLLANMVLGVTAFMAFPILFFPVIWIAWFVLVMVGGVSAASGNPFRYPLTIRFVRS